MSQRRQTTPDPSDDVLRQATEAEEAGKDSLGSAATNTPPPPGPLLDQFLKWISGSGPFPRRSRPPQN
jgi:hypothetical protein